MSQQDSQDTSVVSNVKTNKYYVYADTLPTGEIFYVGKGSGMRKYKIPRNPKQSAFWKKHPDSKRKILQNNLSEQEAWDLEVKYIADLKLNYCRYPENHLACNFSDGGEGPSGRKLSEEHKEKIRQYMLHHNPFKGKVHTKEQREKMSAAHKGKPSGKKGKPNTEEHNQKIRIACTGKKHSEATKQKLKIASTGNTVNVGRKHSEQTKQKHSITANKRTRDKFGRWLPKEASVYSFVDNTMDINPEF